MEKRVYIFNCDGTVDISNTFELYTAISEITSLDCTRYSLVFKDETGKNAFSVPKAAFHVIDNNIFIDRLN